MPIAPMAPRTLALVDYPGASRAALEGLTEIAAHADRLCARQGQARIGTARVGPGDLPEAGFAAVVLPPAFGSTAYLAPDPAISDWLARRAARGSLIASACAGAFYLGAAGLLDGRRVTTHWALADTLAARHPAARLKPERLTLSDGPILTAGGLFLMDRSRARTDRAPRLARHFARPWPRPCP